MSLGFPTSGEHLTDIVKTISIGVTVRKRGRSQ